MAKEGNLQRQLLGAVFIGTPPPGPFASASPSWAQNFYMEAAATPGHRQGVSEETESPQRRMGSGAGWGSIGTGPSVDGAEVNLKRRQGRERRWGPRTVCWKDANQFARKWKQVKKDIPVGVTEESRVRCAPFSYRVSLDWGVAMN